MSTPLSSLKKGKRLPFSNRARQIPFRSNPDVDLGSIIVNEDSNTKVSENSLMASMMTRLSAVEKRVQESEQLLYAKDKHIKALEERCNTMHSIDDTTNYAGHLQRKCHKLQKQVQEMEEFLEDYGMIWCGRQESSDDDGGGGDCGNDTTPASNTKKMWKPGESLSNFCVDFDLVLQNIHELNKISGEGEHFIKHTNDGATFQIREPVPLTLYKNGIFMFGGPFRPYMEATTQTCVQDMMDGYFPSELQTLYPDGVPIKVEDKRDVYFRDKRLERLFPGPGQTLSPEKKRAVGEPILSERIVESKRGKPKSLDSFLSNLPSSTIQGGKVVDVRGGLRNHLKPSERGNDVIVVETDVVKEMKLRWRGDRQLRPKTPCNVTTLRVKSENGEKVYLLKMFYLQTIHDVKKALDSTRDCTGVAYDLKTSFPNKIYARLDRSLKEYNLVPNATLHIVVRN